MVTWHKGRYQAVGLNRWLCVNPLSWDRTSVSPATRNSGALPFAGLGNPVSAVRSVTGARCSRGRLVISIPASKREGFTDTLTKLGSYHNLDYALFYGSVRRNIALLFTAAVVLDCGLQQTFLKLHLVASQASSPCHGLRTS